MNPLYFILFAGGFAGLFQIARKVISTTGFSPLLNATIVSLTAGIVGIFILWREGTVFSHMTNRGLMYAVLSGLLVLPIDYFVLKAYQRGLPITLGSVILVAVSAGMAVLFGMLLLHEPIRPMKFLAIALIFCGILILKTVK